MAEPVLGSSTLVSESFDDRKDVKLPQTDEVVLRDEESLEEKAEPVTSRSELWSYYMYRFGNNSAGPLSYAPLIFQYLLSVASVNSDDHSQLCSDSPATASCAVKFGGGWYNTDSLVLTCNGIIFAISGGILLCFGSLGDYGKWKKWILIVCSIVCWAAQFAFLGLKRGSQYEAAIGIYILTVLSFNLCVAFWTPSFAHLARNTPEAIAIKTSFQAGELTEEAYETEKMLQRNRLSNTAFWFQSVGYTFTLLIALGAAYGLHANSSSAGNLQAAVIIVGISTGVWILAGTPWFFLEKDRAAPLPQGETYFSVGTKTYLHAFKEIPKLSQTWLYLVGYFIISDGYATTNQIYGLCQNAIVSYNVTTSTELYIVQGVANAVGIYVFWFIQKHYKIRTKTLLIVNCSFLILMPIWGSIGIGTDKFGFHKLWEVWAFSIIDCALVAPFYPLSATMLSDLCPKGREVTFFALYALFSKATAWIGPIIAGVIIDRTGNTWTGFPFALALAVVGFALICLVDVEKGKAQADEYVKNDPTLTQQPSI